MKTRSIPAATPAAARRARPARPASEHLWLVCAPGLEALLAAEARASGLTVTGSEPGGVSAEGALADIVRANIALRTASRVLVRVAEFRATAFHELERAAKRVDWERWVAAGSGAAVRVRATCRKSKLYHSDAVAERVLGAVERTTGAATAAKVAPDDEGEVDEGAGAQLVVVRLFHDRCTISIDSSGALLHRRGYRRAIARAPLRETIAAAMLLAADWTGDRPLVDPLCGAGTIPIEAALLARRIAPNVARAAAGALAVAHWPELDAAVLAGEIARARDAELPRAAQPILGSDRDAGAIDAARANAARAGVEEDIAFSVRALSAIEPPAGPGLLVANPPYGVRASHGADVRNLFAQLGKVAPAVAPGWRIGVLSPDRALDAQLRLPVAPRVALDLSNGGIRVRYLLGEVAGGVQ